MNVAWLHLPATTNHINNAARLIQSELAWSIAFILYHFFFFAFGGTS